MIDLATDMRETMPNIPLLPGQRPRTQFQVVVTAEDTWLKPYLIETDIYICPSEAMHKIRRTH